jgi:gliding motility-associated-like protein
VVLCNGDRAYLRTTYNLPNTQYFWNTGAATPEIMAVTEGVYSLLINTWIKDSTILCHYSDTIRVISSPYPIADFEAEPTAGCIPFSAQFQNLTDFDNHVHPYNDVAVSYFWEVYDDEGNLQATSYESDPRFEFTKQSNYHIKLVATTNAGCSDTLIKYNYIYASTPPQAEFLAVPETQFLSDGDVYFLNFVDTTILAAESTIWHWDFGDGTVDSSDYSPTHHYEDWGDYEVTFYVSNDLNCSDQITHRVSIEAELKFPNVITPNGDGLNDVFAIEDLNPDINPNDPSKFRTNQLSIFNRWGKKVYEAENYDTYAKNGEITIGKKVFAGENCSDGTYYYTFFYKGKIRSINMSGTLMIFREAK